MANAPMTQTDSIVDHHEELHQRIARRAFDSWDAKDITVDITPQAVAIEGLPIS